MDLPEEQHLIHALGTVLLGEHSCTVRGLHFYMPRASMGRVKNALDLFAEYEVRRTELELQIEPN